MKTEETKLINTIADRIKTEREKHPFIDWEIFAAQKIYDTLITFWQEKTRWIPVEERLPEIKAHPYQILVKNESINTMYIASQHDIDLLKDKCLGFTHWKEID